MPKKRRVRMIANAAIAALATVALTAAGRAASDVKWETPAEKAAADATRVKLQWGVSIPMRDGIALNATVYRAENAAGRLPVIFGMTPYISDTYYALGQYYAKRGYVLVVVDSRGRGNSGGEFHPFLQDADDGHDAVEWLAAQPWSNGKVAMIGGSYGGANQWATAKESPEHLTSIVPTAPGFFGIDFPGVNNVMRAYDMQWLMFTNGKAANGSLFGDQVYWGDLFTDLHTGKVAFKDFDNHVGGAPDARYQRWIDHPYFDEYWQSITPTPEEYARIDLPILSITGHYDGNQQGTLEFYNRHMKHGSAKAKANHYLIIGPWDHGGTRAPRKDTGGVDIGDAAMLDMHYLSKTWYDWTLKHGPRPSFLEDRVAYYVTGTNEWRWTNSLDAIGRQKRILYLDGNGARSPSAYGSGLLSAKAPAHQTMVYVDDPRDTAKTVAREKGRAPDYQNLNWLVYQDDVLAIDGNGLVFHTPPFEEDTELAGFVALEMWMSMDVPDTDFRASLYEILPNGDSILLTNTIERARYRKSLEQPVLVTPGAIEKYSFNRFPFVARLIRKGSRLRLAFDGNDNIAWQQNFNAGGVVAEETAKDARKATVTIYQNAKYPSRIILPLGEGAD
ncbi:CocE/NonD family hydrolase [Sphingosinicella rhizophila]|uniref:CocE/NonD family hydrolase n=1 Tax=Sphingosinicella rhizophila TaxID=3050082 RepID=A0ABU3Q8T3_9SPHN|nr:CocE/NonD family hydrolase [Sphingosinicella sp. GR2756]MDT9599727.1 CocE/NonD family hydrolase [Sphingosinicella sp. GR2756]